MSVAIFAAQQMVKFGCEILEQHAVYKDVPTTNYTKKDAICRIVEKANVM